MPMKVSYTVIDGEVIAENRGGVRSRYVADPLGSTVALLNNTQAQTDTYTYWPYGESTHVTGSNPTPFQFVGTQGYFTDSTTKTYVRSRMLEPVKGRWLTEDPIRSKGGDQNFYRYIKNDPVGRSDPSGLIDFPGWVCGAAVEAYCILIARPFYIFTGCAVERASDGGIDFICIYKYNHNRDTKKIPPGVLTPGVSAFADCITRCLDIGFPDNYWDKIRYALCIAGCAGGWGSVTCSSSVSRFVS